MISYLNVLQAYIYIYIYIYSSFENLAASLLSIYRQSEKLTTDFCTVFSDFSAVLEIIL